MKCENCNSNCTHYQSIGTINETRRYYHCPKCNTIMIQILKPTTPGCAELIRVESITPKNYFSDKQSTLDNYFL